VLESSTVNPWKARDLIVRQINLLQVTQLIFGSHKVDIGYLVALGLKINKVFKMSNFVDASESIVIQLQNSYVWEVLQETVIERFAFLINISQVLHFWVFLL